MSLQSGLDLVAITSSGIYTETYGNADGSNRANLFVSLGLFEDAPDIFIDGGRIYILGSSIIKF